MLAVVVVWSMWSERSSCIFDQR